MQLQLGCFRPPKLDAACTKPHLPPSHLSCCDAADALLYPAPQVGLPQVVQAHAPVGADQGLPQGRGREGLRGVVLDSIAALQLLLDVLCSTVTGSQGGHMSFVQRQVVGFASCWRE